MRWNQMADFLVRMHAHVFVSGMAIMMLMSCTHTPVKPEHVTRGDYTAVAEYVRALAQKEMADHDVVGMSVALVDDQQIVWSEGFGYADKAHNIKATPDTLYRVGSIAQLFTASAVMQLVEQGKLDLDQPLQTYLPEFRIKTRFPRSAAITLRNLMTHHSGLPENYRKGMVGSNLKPFSGLMQSLHHEYAAYPTNLVFSYSYLGSTLLGITVTIFDGERKALSFGVQKINLHQEGQELEPRAKAMTPGSADFCFG